MSVRIDRQVSTVPSAAEGQAAKTSVLASSQTRLARVLATGVAHAHSHSQKSQLTVQAVPNAAEIANICDFLEGMDIHSVDEANTGMQVQVGNKIPKLTHLRLWEITQDLCLQWKPDDEGAIGCRNIVAALYYAAMFLTGGKVDQYPTILNFFPTNNAWFNFENRFLGFYIKEKIHNKKVSLTEKGRGGLNLLGDVKVTVLKANESPGDWEKLINRDCAKATQDMVTKIVDQKALANTELECYLLAAEYIKVEWKYLFAKNETEENARFFGFQNGEEQGEEARCRMMKNSTKYCMFTGEHCRGVFLPTKTDNIQILAVLPHIKETAGVTGEDSPIWKATHEIATRGDEVMAAANKQETSVTVEIPRMEVKLEATSVLDKCGKVFPKELFDRFGGLTESYNETTKKWESVTDLRIGAIDHATYFMMNEIGAKAAAATGVSMYRSMAARDQPLRFDRPYIVYIVNTDMAAQPAVLFKATVMHSGPLANAKAPTEAEYNEALARK